MFYVLSEHRKYDEFRTITLAIRYTEEEKKADKKNVETSVVYELDNMSDLIKLISLIGDFDSSVYYYEEKYLLVIHCDKKTHGICLEFANVFRKQIRFFMWHVQEHGKIIRENDAVPFLRKVLV